MTAVQLWKRAGADASVAGVNGEAVCVRCGDNEFYVTRQEWNQYVLLRGRAKAKAKTKVDEVRPMFQPKPLVWVVTRNTEYEKDIAARVLGVEYRVDCQKKNGVWTRWRWIYYPSLEHGQWSDGGSEFVYDTQEEAKAAAERDWMERLRQVILPVDGKGGAA